MGVDIYLENESGHNLAYLRGTYFGGYSDVLYQVFNWFNWEDYDKQEINEEFLNKLKNNIINIIDYPFRPTNMTKDQETNCFASGKIGINDILGVLVESGKIDINNKVEVLSNRKENDRIEKYFLDDLVIFCKTMHEYFNQGEKLKFIISY